MNKLLRSELVSFNLMESPSKKVKIKLKKFCKSPPKCTVWRSFPKKMRKVAEEKVIKISKMRSIKRILLLINLRITMIRTKIAQVTQILTFRMTVAHLILEVSHKLLVMGIRSTSSIFNRCKTILANKRLFLRLIVVSISSTRRQKLVQRMQKQKQLN